MSLTAFLLRPWTHIIRAKRCVPRSLADDLLVFGIGADHARRVHEAYTATFGFLHTLGAKVSASKCYLFSTCSATRILFKQKYWTHICAKV